MVFENTHPALITREVWDMVQRVRKNKRRLTKMEEQNKYSGLVFCADCGSNMVLHRAHTMSASYNHFTCRTYKKDGEACTGHYIRECVLDEIVLEDLRRVTSAGSIKGRTVVIKLRSVSVGNQPRRLIGTASATGRSR